jgi:hypothetical protein
VQFSISLPAGAALICSLSFDYRAQILAAIPVVHYSSSTLVGSHSETFPFLAYFSNPGQESLECNLNFLTLSVAALPIVIFDRSLHD